MLVIHKRLKTKGYIPIDTYSISWSLCIMHDDITNGLQRRLTAETVILPEIPSKATHNADMTAMEGLHQLHTNTKQLSCYI